MPDSRVYFAAERTLLAWVRTGLTIIALGFVIERFGLFIRVISVDADHPILRAAWPSHVIGIGLVVLGSTSILAALWNHTAYVRTLPAEDIPALPLRWLTSALALGLAGVGLVMAIYLAAT